MTSLDDIKTELIDNVKFQETPLPMEDSDYMNFTIQGVKRLYVDEGIEDNWKVDFDKVNNTLVRNLSLTETEYAWIAAEIAFRGQISNDLSNLVSFTTDALAVSSALQPFKNSQLVVQSLEARLSVLSFKFTHQNPTIYNSSYDNYPYGSYSYSDHPFGENNNSELGDFI